jgi:hypothetical protein
MELLRLFTSFSNQNNLKNFTISLLKDYSIQKNFVYTINKIISLLSSGKSELMPILDLINKYVSNIIQELGLPFCDLLYKNNIIEFYINLYKNSKSTQIKQILISFINVFNFASENIVIVNDIIFLLIPYDNKFNELKNVKKREKNEIEDLYDKIINTEYFEDNIDIIFKKMDDLEQDNSIPNSVIQFLKEKIYKKEKIESMKIFNLNVEKNNNNNIKINNNQLSILKENNNHNIKPSIFCNIINSNNNNINSINEININNSNNEINNNKVNNFNYFQYSHDKDIHKDLEFNKELKKVKETPLKNRDFLYRDEVISDEENEYIEFKNYSYPFNQEIINELKRQYCGFLNSKGGMIYIGITDNRVVRGLFLDYKTRDIIKNELINITYDFYPKCRIDKINIYFIPIKSLFYNKNIEGLYCIKIIIMPGELYNLYSMTNKGGFISSLRLSGQCINLTAEEIFSEIMKRVELYKNRIIMEKNNDTNKDDDEVMEKSEEISEDSNSDDNENDKTKKGKKVIYVVKITNIDTSLKIKDINRFFNGCGGSRQIFPAENKKSKGYGEIHFPRKETAKTFMQNYNGRDLCGNKIFMKLRKRTERNTNN